MEGKKLSRPVSLDEGYTLVEELKCFNWFFSPCIKTIELWQTEALVFVIATYVTWIFLYVWINYIAWWMDVDVYIYILHLKEEF